MWVAAQTIPDPIRVEQVGGTPWWVQPLMTVVAATIPAAIALLVVWRSNRNQRRLFDQGRADNIDRFAAESKIQLGLAKEQADLQRELMARQLDHQAQEATRQFEINERRALYARALQCHQRLMAVMSEHAFRDDSLRDATDAIDLLNEFAVVEAEITMLGPSEVLEVAIKVSSFWQGAFSMLIQAPVLYRASITSSDENLLGQRMVELGLDLRSAATNDMLRLRRKRPSASSA